MALELPLLKSLFKTSRESNEGVSAKPEEKYWSCTGANFVNTTAVSASIAWASGTATAQQDWEPLIPVEGLPDEGDIMNVSLYGTFVGDWYFYRKTISTGAVILLCQGGAGAGTVALNQYSKINNKKYAYYFVTDAFDVGQVLYGATIGYSI